MQEKEKNQKGTEVKVFPVPLPLGEIKRNNTILTNTSTQPSKEQIINQAFTFHSQGNIQEALKSYQYSSEKVHNLQKLYRH